MSKYDEIFRKARAFIYRNARPLDMARWRYHFEGGNREDVLTALVAYQNADGGFGYALEADSFNPNSSPIQTWAACEILREIGFTDSSHAIIKGILRYLDSGADFSEKHNQWLNVVETNNDYPHAVWWSYSEKQSDDNMKYNPTAYLAGFILRFADKDSGLYKKAEKIARQAYEWFVSSVPFREEHITACFAGLYEYLSEAGLEPFDMREFADKLKEEVNADICRETEKWRTEYVTLPSDLIKNRESMFFEDNKEPVKKECEMLAETQLEDGSYIVPWLWYNDYKEFTLAENWWKSELLIKYMRFLSEFGERQHE